jgi:cyclophilin family peptidyl-prolyl cis-trans isomerase
MTRPRILSGIAALVAIPVLAACTGGGGGTAASPAPPVTAAPSVEAPAPSDAASVGGLPATCPDSQPDPLPAGETRTVTISTEEGDIEILVEADLSPIAAGNFVALADCGWYDGVVFHRVVPGFVIQGGDGQYGRSPDVDPNLVGTGGPPYTIEDEPVTATYGRGTVAMARTSAPDSVGSQFFIVTDDAAEEALSSYNTYQIIGTVTSGMEVADAITTAAAGVESPSEPVVMTDVSVANP